MSPSQTQKVLKFIPEARNEELQHRRSQGVQWVQVHPQGDK